VEAKSKHLVASGDAMRPRDALLTFLDVASATFEPQGEAGHTGNAAEWNPAGAMRTRKRRDEIEHGSRQAKWPR